MNDAARKDRRGFIAAVSTEVDRQIAVGPTWCLAPQHRPTARAGVDCELFDKADEAWEIARQTGKVPTMGEVL